MADINDATQPLLQRNRL